MMIITFLIFLYQLFEARAADTSEMLLFNFSQSDAVRGWVESSDTVREVGMSKAALVLQRTQVFQRAVFFTMLNPQPNGAGFAGINYHSKWNLTNFEAITMKIRGQGQNSGYKVVLRHRGQNQEPHPTYEQVFTAPKEFEVLTLPLSNFKPYYRGRPVDADPLDKSFVSSIGLQVYGGVYLPEKQFGVSSLEIDWIKAV